MKILDANYDNRSSCLSLIVNMSLSEYKQIVFSSFTMGGNLAGQRDVIKRSSVAAKIRKRMHDDFLAGAIFPHVVIGILQNEEAYSHLQNCVKKGIPIDLAEMLENVDDNNISIIDGMQRSNIYFSNFEGNEERVIRVEFWVSNQSVKLLYRMLVLNTGQVPWNTRRQVEVIFSNLSTSIITSLFAKYPYLSEQVEIISVDDGRYRTQAGKFYKDTMIEMYLGYNTRKIKVDMNDELADEFQRFDMMEAIEHDINYLLFVDAFSYLCKLDICFSQFTSTSSDRQFNDGKDIFRSVPACLGFIVACAEYVMGKIPVERSNDIKCEKNQNLTNQIEKIISMINNNANSDFFALTSLNDVAAQLPKSRIGDEMRALFKSIFNELLRYDEIEEIPSLEAFWRS